ncbi:unnamed protein product, partial [Polarella glacialis]
MAPLPATWQVKAKLETCSHQRQRPDNEAGASMVVLCSKREGARCMYGEQSDHRRIRAASVDLANYYKQLLLGTTTTRTKQQQQQRHLHFRSTELREACTPSTRVDDESESEVSSDLG